MQRRISETPAFSSLSGLPESGRTLALERFQTIHPFLEEDVSLSEVARSAGMSARMAWYWVERYRKDGLVGLARQVPHDKGRQRLSPALQQVIEGLALRKGRAVNCHRSPQGSRGCEKV